jgi:hypothetical protein
MTEVLAERGLLPDAKAEGEPATLTDGELRSRLFGAVASGMGQRVGLENCHSPDVTRLPIGELRAQRLRAVTPTRSE